MRFSPRGLFFVRSRLRRRRLNLLSKDNILNTDLSGQVKRQRAGMFRIFSKGG